MADTRRSLELIARISGHLHTAAMVHYRRNRVPGASYFFTVALEDRSSRLLVDSIDCFRRAYVTMLRRHPVRTIAISILPDHLHAIWKLPEADSDYSGRWRALKSSFVHELRKDGLEIPINGRGEAAIWQRRFWEHTIRDDNDLRSHIDYVHWNPVKHGHARRVRDWPFRPFTAASGTAKSRRIGAAA